ncbi:copper amine oxidase N-terminal domain-containing protein [Heliorestis acidaminivorans]|uniref:copper amine oxidase N-terminal domain-containing protein n=1 Tax=Heliorestis acidaminivorans TaxID=553427 RepID=UPI0014796FEE|nr:copper amine oxidase N-terminal domain-containing protein [Heliorestis acidaminivorans]
MFKKNKKSIALLVTLMFVLSMILPMGAFASTFSVPQVGVAAPGGTFDSRVIVEVPEFAAADGDHAFILRLPNNSTVAEVAYNVTGSFKNAAVTQNSDTEYRFVVSLESENAKGRLVIDLDEVTVPSGLTGDFKINFEAPANSIFKNASVTIATVGAGTVTATIDDVNNFGSSGTVIEPIRIKEDRPGAFKSGNDSIKLKLPQGFTWVAPAENTVIAPEWGNVEAYYGRVSDAGRTLEVKVAERTGAGTEADPYVYSTGNNRGQSTQASYIVLSNLEVEVDESLAKKGDVAVTLSGKSSVTPSSLVVGFYGDYGVNVDSFGEVPTLTAGRSGEEIGKIVIEETLAGSMPRGRTITLTLPENTKWAHNRAEGANNALTQAPVIDSSESNNTDGLFVTPSFGDGIWAPVDTERRTIRATINTPSEDAAKVVFEKGEILIAPNFRGDLIVEVAGTAGVSGKLLLGKVAAPITAEVANVNEVKIGLANQPASDIVITESAQESIMSRAGHNQIAIELPLGVDFTSTPKFEVVEGDLVLEPGSATTTTINNRRVAIVNTRATSTVPSTIKVSGINLTVDRTVPEGNVEVSIRGNALTEIPAGVFTSSTAARAVIAKVSTPAPGDVKRTASFTVNDTTYYVNGVAKTMDAAPYIKNDRTYMPVRYVADALGIAESNIIWDGANQTATLIQGSTVVQVTVGSNVLTVNGATITMDVAPEIAEPGRVMLPLRHIAERFGAVATWDAATQTANLN